MSTESVLTLKKSNLLSIDATAMIALSKTYKSGRITQGLMGQIANRGGGTRTFVAGEKIWITGIDVTSKGVVFALFSDSYSGVHYWTNLTFPFAKGSVPSAADALALIGEVVDPETSGTEVGGELPTTPAPDDTAWDSRYGRMTSEDLHRINDATVRYDLNYFRLSPSALDQRPVLQYFIALNNCDDRNIERALFNELDYPALATFYKSRASQILASLPKTVADVALYRYIDGHKSGNWVLWSKSLSLGEYDRQRKAFPLKYPGKDSVEIADSLSTESNGRDLTKSCPAAAKAARAANSYLPTTYSISLKPALYRELPMDEDAARRYIDGAGPQRNVFLAVDVTILNSPPNVSRANNTISQVSLHAQTARIRVIDGNTQKPLGTLFDDHSLPAEVHIAQERPSPPAKPADRWAFGDHMYEIRTAVYVYLASDACGWPLTAEQSANVRAFVDQVSVKGRFNERYQYNLADSQTKNTINSNGRRSFCGDAAERRKFDKLAATIAPLGALAAPSSR